MENYAVNPVSSRLVFIWTQNYLSVDNTLERTLILKTHFKNLGRKAIKRLLYGEDSWTYQVFGTEKTDKTTAKGSYRLGINLKVKLVTQIAHQDFVEEK